MRTPESVGLPKKRFPAWRRGQERVLRQSVYADERFIVWTLPTGFGKTPAALGYLGFNDDQRAVYLTATRQLQGQVNEQGRFLAGGMADIRGRSNYDCNIDERKTAATADCTAGVFCSLMRDGGCTYFDKRRFAGQSRLVSTNYSYWLHDEDSGGLGKFPVLICDEGHQTPEEISKFAAVEISIDELERFRLPEPPYKRKPTGAGLGDWANRAVHQLERAMEGEKRIETRRQAKILQRKLGRLCRLNDQEWLQQGGRSYERWRWDLIDPGALAESLLFRGAQRVILVSATIRRKTLELLGVDPRSSNVRVIEQDSSFPVKRRPIYYWPVAKCSYKMSGEDRRRWLQAHDLVIGPRLDRKGLIHPHSYERGEEIWRASKYRERMILHRKGESLEAKLREFDAAPLGYILNSPAINTGVDFPKKRAEYQIVSKAPWPVFTDPLVKARQARDKDWSAYTTLQTLTQTYGRVNRSDDDQGETIVLDGHVGWLRHSHWDFTPRWVHAAFKTVSAQDLVPPPPPPLPLG